MYRNIKLASRIAKPQAAAVFLLDKTTALPAGYKALDKQLGGVLSDAIKRSEFSASKGSITTLYPDKGPARLFIAGLGSADRFESNSLRVASAKLARAAFAAKVTELEIHAQAGVGDKLTAEQIGAAVGDGLAIASHDFDTFKGAVNQASEKPKPIDLKLTVDAELRGALSRSVTVAQGVNTARTLAATPPNVANPSYIVDHCRKLAKRTGLKCTIIDQAKAKKLNMGGLLAVGQAGSTPPALICLEWPGKTASKSKRSASKPKAPVMLVGKAVTFDTGGYSLKPSPSMAGMKYDKCGGMAVIGAMQAVAELKLPQPVVGLIPVAENMIDENAYRVDDIITFCNGVTAEIANTDAEGRLILADALAYGTKHYKPKAVIDLATLTGGVVVALGYTCAGLWVNDDKLRDQLQQAAQNTGEKLWQLPLWDDHRDQMKGTHADLTNSADRSAHPIQGAAFLSFFVGEEAPKKLPTTPWAHLDIAGVADAKSDNGLYPKGPTGFGVRLLLETLRNWA